VNVDFDFDYVEYVNSNNLWSLLDLNKGEYGDVTKKNNSERCKL